MRRRILVIAPDTSDVDLPKMAIEIGAIQRYHDATVLRGNVRDQDIAAHIADDGFEILWFIAHGTEQGVLLSDGLLRSSALVQYVKADDTKLCVLNTCASEDVALQLASQSGADVICTIGQIDNKDALRLGQLLAGELAFANSYREAFELVATPDSNYRYYEGRGIYRGRPMDDKLSDEMAALSKALYKLDSNFQVEIALLKERNSTQSRWIEAADRHWKVTEKQIATMQQHIAALQQHSEIVRKPPAVTLSQSTLLILSLLAPLLSGLVLFLLLRFLR